LCGRNQLSRQWG